MGQAKQRGTYAERRAQALIKAQKLQAERDAERIHRAMEREEYLRTHPITQNKKTGSAQASVQASAVALALLSTYGGGM